MVIAENIKVVTDIDSVANAITLQLLQKLMYFLSWKWHHFMSDHVGKVFKVNTWFSSTSVLNKISIFQNSNDMNTYENADLCIRFRIA